MINYLSLLGWNDGTDNEIFTREELIESFDVDRVVKSPSVFDMSKLKWVNAQHMKMMSVEELAPLVEEQFGFLEMLEEGADKSKVDDFVFAATSLAKQMMETTQDAALNAKTVLGYGLPASFADLPDGEAKEMIKQGNFYPIAKAIISDTEANNFPMPDPSNPMDAFLDESKKIVEADEQSGGSAYSYSAAYKAHMKGLSKDMNVKGKNLFHPIRLALTGEMSGQDVTKQLSLLELACAENSPVNAKAAGLVTFAERLNLLSKFTETIPDEFRAPKVKEEAGKSKKDEKSEQKSKEVAGSSAVQTAPADPLETYDGPPVTALDIRVGRITKVWEHPEADKLYCEEIDVGEDEPRQIASGLRPYMKAEDMEGRLVLVLCNLKERKMLGFPSHGMVLCASNEDHTDVKFVNPPVDAKIGERVTIPGFDFEGEEGQPYAENKIGKKKVFETLAPFLVTNEYGVPEFLGRPFLTSAGVCTSAITKGTVS
jgi:methionine--tRNA ligase beta chain